LPCTWEKVFQEHLRLVCQTSKTWMSHWPQCPLERNQTGGTELKAALNRNPCSMWFCSCPCLRMCIGPENNTNNFEKITYTVHCKKLAYFSRLGQVAELPNTALPENWLFIKSNNWFANSQKKLIIMLFRLFMEWGQGWLRWLHKQFFLIVQRCKLFFVTE